MPSILECNRIINSVYPYSLNFTTLFASHLSSILALFFSKSLVKLLLHDKRSSILTQVLLFRQLFHCHKCSCGQGLRIARILNWAEGEVLSRTTQSIQVRSSSTNIRPSLKKRSSYSSSSIGRASN